VIDVQVMRTMPDLMGLNVLTLMTIPLRFQIAPGTAASLGIADVDYTISFDGSEIAGGQTNADGEVSIPLLALMGTLPAVLRILDTDFNLTLHPGLQATNRMDGRQRRLEHLGYMTGYQLVAIGGDQPDDNTDGPRTQQAIMNFQMDESLTVDGDTGNQTTTKLRTAVGGV
jgi:peptidoglycan hydrolase-like protein with peptidoglycan-binding domain